MICLLTLPLITGVGSKLAVNIQVDGRGNLDKNIERLLPLGDKITVESEKVESPPEIVIETPVETIKPKPTTPQEYAKEQTGIIFGEQHFEALKILWQNESGWNMYAVNKSSGACGIPQSLPCNKMATSGLDYLINYETQIDWGLNYINGRYKNPTNALAFWYQNNWY